MRQPYSATGTKPAGTFFRSRPSITTCLTALSGLLAGTVLTPALTRAHAEEFCSEPIAPYCTSASQSFDDHLQYRRCAEDLDRYEEKVRDYEDCVTRKVKALKDGFESLRKDLEARKNDSEP